MKNLSLSSKSDPETERLQSYNVLDQRDLVA